jgi:hypothetical protein
MYLSHLDFIVQRGQELQFNRAMAALLLAAAWMAAPL